MKFTMRQGGEEMATINVAIHLTRADIADLKRVAGAVYGDPKFWRKSLEQATYEAVGKAVQDLEEEVA